jgi:Resolvase, N terminal domain
MKYGYARVSSKGRDYTAQVEALKAAGCESIFSEKASGKSTDSRPEFAKLQKLRPMRGHYFGGCRSPVNQPTASDFIGSSNGMAICST